MQPPIAIPAASAALTVAFSALAIVLGLTFIVAASIAWRRTGADAASHSRALIVASGATVIWFAATIGAAALGYLSFSGRPPSMVFPLVGTLLLALGIALSPAGARLAAGIPIAALVGFQGFRVIVELLLHRAYTEGLMPVQMSYSGRNFDIISGVTAIALGLWLSSGRRSLRLIMLWNVLSLALLVNIVAVALLSAPTPLRVFMNEPANVWVTMAPWIWLPTVMVLAAIVGHIVVFRYLGEARRIGDVSAAQTPSAPASFDAV